MIGPVFYLEMLLGSRRGKAHVLRWILGGWVVLQLLFFYAIYWGEVQSVRNPSPWNSGPSDPDVTFHFANDFSSRLINQQYLLLLLAVPVFTAGAITDEKARGTMIYLLTADLTPWEILIGKLLGRAYQVAILYLTIVPVICFLGLFGGITPPAIVAIILSAIGPVFALGSASLLASVWSRTTRDAVVGLYSVLAMAYLAIWGLSGLSRFAGLAFLKPLSQPLAVMNPLYVAEPAFQGQPDYGRMAWRLVSSLLAWGAVGGACYLLAVARFRAAYIRQLENSGRRRVGLAWLTRRPPVGDEPLRWKERNVHGVAPLAIFYPVPRGFWIAGIVIATVLIVAAFSAIGTSNSFFTSLSWFLTYDIEKLQHDSNIGAVEGSFLALSAVVLLIASLTVGIRCSGTIVGEREKSSWEALLLTPLETKQLIRNKLWGILGATAPYVLAFATPALILAAMVSPLQSWFVLPVVLIPATLMRLVPKLDSVGGYWLVLGAALLAMALSLVVGAGAMFLILLCLVFTAVAMFYIGAAGIWCSVRSKTSWRALLETLGWGYAGGFAIWVCTLPVTVILGLLLAAVLSTMVYFDRLLGTSAAPMVARYSGSVFVIGMVASVLVLAGFFLLVPWYWIREAEKKVGYTERTRHWGDEPRRMRRRRRIRTVRPADE